MIKQNLYKVIKIPVSMIYRKKVKVYSPIDKKMVVKEPHEFDVGEYTYQDAYNRKELVSIGDNLVFHKIREYYGNTESPDKIFDEIQELYKKRDEIKKLENTAENRKQLKDIKNEINRKMYVKDIVNVKVSNKEHYEEIALATFKMNGITYKRFCCGAGQMRRNTVTFVNADLYDYLTESLMNGLKGRIKSINLAKLSTYFALSFSSVLWIRTPRICVVSDFDTTLKNQHIFYHLTLS